MALNEERKYEYLFEFGRLGNCGKFVGTRLDTRSVAYFSL